jgi:hypothetical protein
LAIHFLEISRYQFDTNTIVPKWQSYNQVGSVLGTRCHPNHQIASGNRIKIAYNTEDKPDLEPNTEPMPAHGKVGIRSARSRCQSHHQVSSAIAFLVLVAVSIANVQSRLIIFLIRHLVAELTTRSHSYHWIGISIGYRRLPNVPGLIKKIINLDCTLAIDTATKTENAIVFQYSFLLG